MADIHKYLESTLSGNGNAFNEVVAAYRGMAMALAKKRLGNEALAEEAVQEAFFSAYLNLSQLRNHEFFSSWLRVIIDRCCSRILHKEGAAHELGNGDAVADPRRLDPYDVYTRHLDRSRIQQIIDELSGASREACMLRFVHGRSYSEIAEILDIPLGTVKRRLHDARDKVIREFAKNERKGIRVGHMPISDHLLPMVAHHRHNHTAYSIRLRRFLSWSKLVHCLCNATLDAAFVMAPLAMTLHNQGLGIRYILDGHHDGSAVTISNASGKHLDQKTRLAFPHAISTHRLFLNTIIGDENFRTGNHQETQDIPARFINPSYVINCMLKREIDGFFCSEPWSTKSAAQGAGKILFRSGEILPGHICCVLVVRDEYAEKHPDILTLFTKSLITAGEFITEHPWESARIQAHYTGIDPAVAEHILANKFITYHDLVPDLSRTETVMEMAIKAGVLSRPCDLKRFVYPDYH